MASLMKITVLGPVTAEFEGLTAPEIMAKMNQNCPEELATVGGGVVRVELDPDPKADSDCSLIAQDMNDDAARSMPHAELHNALDTLVAEYILTTKGLSSKTSLLEFMQWSADKMKEEQNGKSFENPNSTGGPSHL